MGKDKTEQIKISPQNGTFFREHNFPTQGAFISYFGVDASIAWESVEVDIDALEHFLESDDWEIVSSLSFIDDDKNKLIYRLLNDKKNKNGSVIDDDFIKRTSMNLVLKNDDIGFVKIMMTDYVEQELKKLTGELTANKVRRARELAEEDEDEESCLRLDMALFWNDEAKDFLNDLLVNYFHYEEKEDKAKTNIIIREDNGKYALREFQIDYDEIDFDRHYNEGLKEFDEKLQNRIMNKKGQSFFIIHGPWGTGKTSYLRYIMANIGADQKLIYLPPSMVNALADPSFVTFMAKHPRSVLVVEDAEEIVRKKPEDRDEDTNSLLNITDGILGNCLDLDIICTFNTEITEIDPAILRKGRLDGRFRLDYLEEDKARDLCDELGIDLPEEGKKRKLGELLNHEEKDNDDNNGMAKIGFQPTKQK